ncbi:MAG TPA: hypothetical protein VHA33_21380 [Candidatus Angelobacter sp.]|jgi:hypothetical protein|nr:hypothetical protein [Candidatus Angelobacter sp.]
MNPRVAERTAKPLPTQKSTFGIVGGYGATGTAVVAELMKSGDSDLLIGGRDPADPENGFSSTHQAV